MIAETISNTGAVPREVSADAGYYSANAVDDLQALGVDRSSRRIRRATAEWFRRRPEDAYPSTCPPGTGCGGSCRPGGAQRYALRMETVEPVFGQIKEGRRGLPPVPAAGTGEGQRRVVADLHRPQP